MLQCAMFNERKMFNDSMGASIIIIIIIFGGGGLRFRMQIWWQIEFLPCYTFPCAPHPHHPATAPLFVRAERNGL